MDLELILADVDLGKVLRRPVGHVKAGGLFLDAFIQVDDLHLQLVEQLTELRATGI